MLAVLGFSIFPLPGAGAAGKTLEASKTAWFWESNQKVSTCTETDPAQAPPLCGVASAGGGVSGGPISPGGLVPITDGHVGVSLKDGAEDMRAYIQLDTSPIPPGSIIESFVVKLTVSQADTTHPQSEGHSGSPGKPPATVNESAAAIRACAVTEPWGPSQGEPPRSTTVSRPNPETADTSDDQPEVTVVRAEPFSDCSLNATGERSEDGSFWTFDITKIAQKWLSLEVFDEGIALLPIETGVEPTWTIEFHGAHTVVSQDDGERTMVTKQEAAAAIVEYTEPPPSDVPPPPPGPEPDSGIIPPTFGNPVPSEVSPPAPETPVGPLASPAPAAGPVGVPRPNPHMPGYVWLLFPFGALALGMVSNAIGSDPASAVGAGNRVAGTLRARRLGRGGETVAEQVEAIAREESALGEQS